ncbi:hypothetical protein JAAARDRAFT_190426 [Jaapia argillacea MUCL 33604]|uniref:Uncharacterized protein n=1 Tax=Jaapia argillacea MUCL 33604 TaxID=933084 RepID=A0A067QHF0_9AGAM|nr:hypothetical protein JAAARDRAFT_190426 [Jaapia argillacea MUCL 33604]
MVDGPFSTFPLHRRKLWNGARGKISVNRFNQWVASLQNTAEQVFVREISWVKQPRFPSHEYILLTFGGKFDPNPIYGMTLRLERDANSWFKIFGSWFGSNCRDTVSISSSSLTAQHSGDRTIAYIAVNRTDIDLRHITLLLEVIGKAADQYKIWSFNCWWYAGCLWRSLLMFIGSNHCRFHLMRRDGQVERFAEFLANTRGLKGAVEWDAMTFCQFQTFSHLATVERASWDNTALDEATGYIEDILKIQVLGKFKGELNHTEGFHNTPTFTSAVNEAIAEFGDLDILPSPRSALLPLRMTLGQLQVDDPDRSVHDTTSLQEFQDLAWSGPVHHGCYRIQHLSSRQLVHVPGVRDCTPLRATSKLHPTTVWEARSLDDDTLMFNCCVTVQQLCVLLDESRYYQPGVDDAIVGCNFSGSVEPSQSHFTVREIKKKGIYTISPAHSELFWNLSDDEEDTVVRLQTDPHDDRNHWKLIKLSDWED